MSISSTGQSEWERKQGGGSAERPSSPVLSVDDVAKLLGLGKNQVYKAISRGEIDVMRIGKRILILRAPLERKLRGEATEPQVA